MGVFEALENLLIANGVSLSKGVLKVLQKRVFVTHLHEVIGELVLIEEIFGTF